MPSNCRIPIGDMMSVLTVFEPMKFFKESDGWCVANSFHNALCGTVPHPGLPLRLWAHQYSSIQDFSILVRACTAFNLQRIRHHTTPQGIKSPRWNSVHPGPDARFHRIAIELTGVKISTQFCWRALRCAALDRRICQAHRSRYSIFVFYAKVMTDPKIPLLHWESSVDRAAEVFVGESLGLFHPSNLQEVWMICHKKLK